MAQRNAFEVSFSVRHCAPHVRRPGASPAPLCYPSDDSMLFAINVGHGVVGPVPLSVVGTIRAWARQSHLTVGVQQNVPEPLTSGAQYRNRGMTSKAFVRATRPSFFLCPGPEPNYTHME